MFSGTLPHKFLPLLQTHTILCSLSPQCDETAALWCSSPCPPCCGLETASQRADARFTSCVSLASIITVLSCLFFNAKNSCLIVSLVLYLRWKDKSNTNYFVVVRNRILSCSLRTQIGCPVCVGAL